MSTDTRATILQTARRLFVQQGFKATSIRQLAQEAGIGKATIYHHFADKQAIVLALLDQEWDADEGLLVALQAESDRRRIETAVRASFAIFQQSMSLIQVVQREVPAGQARLDAEFRVYWQSHTALITAAIWLDEQLPDNALVLIDGSLTPAGETYLRLKGEWTTRLEGQTGGQGEIAFTGAYGVYEVVVTTAGKAQTFILNLSSNTPHEATLTISP